MAGLEYIIDQIRQEAEETARLTVQTAREDAEKVLKEAQAEAARTEKDGAVRAEKEAADIRGRYDSMARTAKRQAVLSARQAEIAGCLGEARAAVLGQDPEAYFAMLEKQIRGRAAAKDGEVLLSAKDLARVPADFAQRVAAAGKAAGGSLTLSREPRNISGGFILVYGGIEENASVEALFDEYADELSDTVCRILFS